jgi:ribosomal protein S18 acetylase RimI-like enzyme
MLIKEITETSVQIHSEIKILLSQLTTSPIQFSMNDLSEIINSKNSILFGAFINNELVGILTLALFNIPTGKNGRIEDVVVNKNFRRKGIGKALTLEAMNKGNELNLDKIFLTSNPSRIEANQLYIKIGFQLRETNSYFYIFKK